jgi:restriction system protein
MISGKPFSMYNIYLGMSRCQKRGTMTIPDFQSIMLPLLEIVNDSKEHSHRKVSEALAAKFNLTEEERNELLPSGRQARFDNRVAWSRAYLKKAGLIENTGRGIFRITADGLELLKSSPSRIDIKLLMQYPGVKEWHKPSSRKPGGDEIEPVSADNTEEVLESSYQELRQALAQELIDRIMKCSPKFFEDLVVCLLVKMGYVGSSLDTGCAINDCTEIKKLFLLRGSGVDHGCGSFHKAVFTKSIYIFSVASHPDSS